MIEQLANAMIDNGIPEYIEVIMAQNLLPKTYVVGYLTLGSKPLILNPVAPGRMAFVKALTAPLEITFWMERCSIA